jgi:type IV pilus assembly protein PilN
MLKINLLPVRQLKKTAKAKKQFFGMVAALSATIALGVIAGVLQANVISNLETDISALNTKKASYAPQLNLIAQYKKDKEEFTRKTEVIKKLKSESSLTVRVLDEVATRIDKQRMWLESLNQQSNSLILTGVALDNQTVAQFMNKLKESPFVKDVSLGNSSQKVVSGRNLKSFDLNCSIAQPDVNKSEVADGKK